MPASLLEIKTGDIAGLQKRLNAAALSPADRTALLKGLAFEVEQQSQPRFDTKTDPSGARWKDIAASTKRYLDKYFPRSRPPLWRTGELRDSIDSWLKDTFSIVVGATKDYASFLQDGTSRMVAREMFGIGDEDAQALIREIDSFLAGRL